MNQEILKKQLYDLSDDQRAAATSKNRFLRIIAGAGAGKTTTMAMRIVYLLSLGASPKEIVAFTFTERAAQNMKNKIYEKVREIEPDLCNKLGEMYIGTIHAFCFQMLQDHFGYGNYDIIDENQESAFILRKGWNIGLGGSGYVKRCMSFLQSIEVVYDELIDQEELRKNAQDFYDKFHKYELLLQEEKLLTFGKIINIMVTKAKNNYKPLSHIKHLIVDEYQDINKAQQELITLIGKNASAYVVGDPRQCIYQWRGSNSDFFNDFLGIFTGADKITIHENRRSCSTIVQTANDFSKTLKGEYSAMKPVRPHAGTPIKVVFDNPQEEAENIVEAIKNLTEIEKKCKYSDISILLRSVKTSAEPFIQELRRQNIPFIIGGKAGLFRRDEAQIVGRIFAWLHPNGFWLKSSYNWNDLLKGEELLTDLVPLWQNIFPGEVFPEDIIREWKEQVLAGSYKGLTEAYQELLLILGFLILNPENKQHAAIMANLGRFNTLLTDYQDSAIRRGRPFNWNSDIKGLGWFMNSYAYEAYEEQPAEDIRGIEAVQILTIHQAKGLEWLAVFVPCMVSSRFPASSTGREQDWLVPRDMFPVARYEGSEDDERRLFYVAITRARDLLCVSWFENMRTRRSPSTFLSDLNLPVNRGNNIFSNIGLNPVHIEDEIQTYAGGEIVEYNRCNYFYLLRYLWSYQSEFNPMLNFGKSLHHCLRLASEQVRDNKKEPEEAIEEAFNNGEFHLPYAGSMMKDLAEGNAKKTLKKYAEKYKQDLLNVQEVEARLEFPLENATIVGRIDVIIDDKGKKEVRDYKTSFEVTTEEESSLQVRLYTLGLSLTKCKVDKASIAALKEKDGEAHVKEVSIAKHDLDNAREQAKKAIEGIKKGIWKPNVTERCKDCDYRKICKYTTAKRKLVMHIPALKGGN